MMKKRGRIGSALLLALILVASVIMVPKVQAANAVDLETLCSIDFSIAGEMADLKAVDGGVNIRLYKVASIDESGSYTAEDAFKGVDVSSLADGNTAAADWLDRAADAAKLVKDTTAVAAETVTDADGLAQIKDLPVGLYLVAAADALTEYYSYSFTPYLISLPNNNYYATGDDSWIYDLTGSDTLSLKPEQTPRYGSLVIDKTLVNQNITMGDEATFIFQVNIEERSSDGVTPGKTSTKLIPLTVDAAGTYSVTVDQIPAGATVIVSEIYHGASYKLTSENDQTAVIVADEQVGVSFTNEHDNSPNGGYGVENSFKLSDDFDQYQWYKDGVLQNAQ